MCIRDSGYAVEAGGVYNLGSLTISNATVSGNAATLYDLSLIHI